MPIVGVGRDKLFERLGQAFTEEEFDELCFQYGVELDDVTSEKDMIRKEHGTADSAAAAAASEEVIYKIDIPANRYDMLCLEGIARALNVFRKKQAAPAFTVASMAGKQMQKIVVKPETGLIRPFVVCAVLRGVTLTKASYDSFIDLQDKLHQNLCRQRSLVAIGAHDLDTIQGPFSYEALPPSDISFVPLKQTTAFEAGALMDHYLQNDQKLKKFVPLIKDSKVYPVIYDAKRTVLSLPPIINGAHSAIKLETKNIFIECTATDLTKAKIVLNTVVTMFSEYCSTPFEVEPVEVVDAMGTSTVYPDLSARTMEVQAQYINRYIGVDLKVQEMAELLTKMQLSSQVLADGETLQVQVPPTRSDVLHACDVVEDVAIAYGFNNVAMTLPPTATVGKELPLNQLTELVRCEAALAGFTEILTWALCSKDENFSHLRKPDDGNTAVEIANPATQEFQVARTSLLPSVLKTFGANKDAPLPVRLFEISDVIYLSDTKQVGARNERRIVAAQANKESGFEVVHGFLNRVMEVLGVPLKGTDAKLEAKLGAYEWRESSEPAFFQGRQAKIYYKAQEVGIFGIVHPEVLENFDVVFPVSAMELNLEPFCFDQSGASLLVDI